MAYDHPLTPDITKIYAGISGKRRAFKEWAVFITMVHRLLFPMAILLLFTISAAAERVYVADIDGNIGQGTLNRFQRALSSAERDGHLLVVRLNTNGGTTVAMEDIVRLIQNADVPVVVYVAPSGAVAYSAGTFILMSGHIAAMGNATVIGACQPRIVNPVSGMPEKADDKEINAFAALMQSLAAAHGRNETMARLFVTDNAALTEHEALDAGVIEVVTDNMSALLAHINGMTVTVNGAPYRINTTDAEVVSLSWGIRDSFINYISDPQIASLLLTIGIFGLIFGFITPGFHLPETLGAVALVMGLYGLSFVGVTAAGVLLVSLAVVFFIVEILTPTFGFWTVAASITFIFGIMLIPAERAMYYMPAYWYTSFRVASIAVLVVLASFFLYALMKSIKAKQTKPRIGKEDLVGEQGVALTDISPKGQAKVRGRIWRVISDDEIKEGDEIVVVEQRRLTLKVRKA